MRSLFPSVIASADGENVSVSYVDFAQKSSIFLGRLCAMASVILIAVWVLKSGDDDKYLGGLNVNDNRVINFHVLFMPLGLIFFSGWSITAFRNPWFSPKWNRNIHAGFHFAAKVCMTIGLIGIQQAKDSPSKNYSSTGYEAHLYSLHSWMGVLTSIFLFQNDILGVSIFLFPYISKQIRLYYKPEHIFLGKFSYILACATVLTGLMDFNKAIDCSYTVGHAESDPSARYLDIPVGCRLSNGAGVLVILTLLFILYGLERRVEQTVQKSRANRTRGSLRIVSIVGNSSISTCANEDDKIGTEPSHGCSDFHEQCTFSNDRVTEGTNSGTGPKISGTDDAESTLCLSEKKIEKKIVGSINPMQQVE